MSSSSAWVTFQATVLVGLGGGKIQWSGKSEQGPLGSDRPRGSQIVTAPDLTGRRNMSPVARASAPSDVADRLINPGLKGHKSRSGSRVRRRSTPTRRRRGDRGTGRRNGLVSWRCSPDPPSRSAERRSARSELERPPCRQYQMRSWSPPTVRPWTLHLRTRSPRNPASTTGSPPIASALKGSRVHRLRGSTEAPPNREGRSQLLNQLRFGTSRSARRSIGPGREPPAHRDEDEQDDAREPQPSSRSTFATIPPWATAREVTRRCRHRAKPDHQQESKHQDRDCRGRPAVGKHQ